MGNGDSMLTFGRFTRRSTTRVGPLIQEVMAECWEACQGSDLIISAHLAGIFGASIAERLNIPHIAAHLFPLQATRVFPNVFCPPLPTWLAAGQSCYNLLSYALARAIFWAPIREALNQARQSTLQLQPLAARQLAPTICAYSPSVLPKPADWPEQIEVTGYWFLDRPPSWQPPNDLLEFLAAGPPPVYIGCGSMVGARRETFLGLAQQALRETGLRGLIVSHDSAGPTSLGDNILVIGEMPHDWLFPRVAAVVHHGGAGTTGAALRAGVPSIIIPFIADQPFWGRRIQELGAGVGPIARRKLTTRRLVEALTLVIGDQRVRQRAAALGQHIRAEDGVANAVNAIHSQLAPAGSPHNDWPPQLAPAPVYAGSR
jgi:UDP:flavonoid glycosyltransferase YjiC (YdhE family)